MQHVLVTGASGNLGKAVIERFLASSCLVTGIVPPGDPAPLQFTTPGFEKMEADLNREDAAVTAVRRATARAPIHTAVLTAGGFAMGDIASTSSADLMAQVNLNFLTAYHAAQPVFRHMLEQGRGRIFLIGARPGLDMTAARDMAGYALSKSLVFRLAELMNATAGKKEVITSVIVPSIIDTPSNRSAMPDADFSAWVLPADIASVIHWHAGPEAAWLREPIIKVYGRS